MYLAMVAEWFAPAAAVNLYCHSDAVRQPTPPGDLRGTHEMMIYAAILLAPCLADVFAKGFLHRHLQSPAFDVLLLKNTCASCNLDHNVINSMLVVSTMRNIDLGSKAANTG